MFIVILQFLDPYSLMCDEFLESTSHIGKACISVRIMIAFSLGGPQRESWGSWTVGLVSGGGLLIMMLAEIDDVGRD